jgi:hypothetical protein
MLPRSDEEDLPFLRNKKTPPERGKSEKKSIHDKSVHS